MSKNPLFIIILFSLDISAMDEQQKGQELGEQLKNAGFHEIDVLLDRVMRKHIQPLKIDDFIRHVSVTREYRVEERKNPQTGRAEQVGVSHFTMTPSPSSVASSVDDSLEIRKSADEQRTRIKAYAMRVIATEMLRKSDELLEGNLRSSDNSELVFTLDDCMSDVGLFNSDEIDPALLLVDAD